MTVAKRSDLVFLSITLILLFSGFLILASASLGLAAQANKNSYLPLLKQVALGGCGIILLWITSRINYKYWRKLALPFFLISFLLTTLVLFPQLGFKHGGAQRWLSIDLFTFQPSELLKFAFVVYLSSWLAKRRNEISSLSDSFIPFLLIVGFVATALILQPDIGTLGIICISSAALFFLAGGKYRQIGFLIIAGIILLGLLVYLKPYMKDRMLVFLNNSQDLQGIGYQLNQAKIALGSGGLFGRGFGEGLSKFNYLPEATGDSIFAVVGEEFGFAGTVFLISLFLIFFIKAMQIAQNAPDTFGRLLASGIAILIITQAFVNMYAIVGLIPLTGVPLTFVSQGGSSLTITLAEVGVILNISKN